MPVKHLISIPTYEKTPTIGQIKKQRVKEEKKVRKRQSHSEGAKPRERYEVGKILSSGMIGIVYLVRDCTGYIPEFKVVKRMSVAKAIDKKLAESLRHELLLLKE